MGKPIATTKIGTALFCVGDALFQATSFLVGAKQTSAAFQLAQTMGAQNIELVATAAGTPGAAVDIDIEYAVETVEGSGTFDKIISTTAVRVPAAYEVGDTIGALAIPRSVEGVDTKIGITSGSGTFVLDVVIVGVC